MPKKSKLELNFAKRDEIKNKLLELLGINDNNKIFYLYKLDADKELQGKILELQSDCEKYFATGGWTFFRNKKHEKLNDRSYLTFIRNVLNFCDVKYINKQTSMIDNGQVKYIMKYIII